MADPAIHTSDIAGPAYGDLIKEQLDEERHRKGSLEQRGISVVASSGFLGAVLFGVAALATEGGQDPPTGLLKWTLGFTLFLFLASAALGMLSNWLSNYEEIPPDELRRLLDHWGGTATIGDKRAAEVRIKMLEDARKKNDLKAVILKWAHRALLAAILFVGTNVGVVLFS